METLVELSQVEETRHLVPNLPRLATSLFGTDCFFLEWFKAHRDWATQKAKHPDGLIWRPWRRELWLVEAEWKLGSNFFDQVRALASGRVDKSSLFRELRACLEPMDDVIDAATAGFEKGYVLDRIVNATLDRHVSGEELRPNLWVILGHGPNDAENLRADYQRELEYRFGNGQRYVLTMARMFQSEAASCMLLEQYCPAEILAEFGRAHLVNCTREAAPTLPSPESGKEAPPPSKVEQERGGTVQEGRTSRVWEWFSRHEPDLDKSHVQLRIRINEDCFEDFQIDWNHLGDSLMVTYKGKRLKPRNAVKRAMRQVLPDSAGGNIARHYGWFLDASHDPPREIVRYRDVESWVWREFGRRARNAQVPDWVSDPTFPSGKGHAYFDTWNVHKAKRAQTNILRRLRLWEVFIEKKQMTIHDFKQHSRFGDKAIAGFAHYLTRNDIANRDGDLFSLNPAAIPYIQRLLAKSSESHKSEQS